MRYINALSVDFKLMIGKTDFHIIKRLREKLKGVSDKWELKTVWGVGYKFEVAQQGEN